MRICFPEGDDRRVIAASRELTKTTQYHTVLWRLKRLTDSGGQTAQTSVHNFEVRENQGDRLLAYAQAFEEVRCGRAEMAFAGLDIPKSEMLPIVFRTFKKEIQEADTFLFSIAYVAWQESQKPRFCMCDPSVIEDPSVEQLASMIIRALPIAGDLLNTQPFACVLSYASGRNTRSHSQKQRDVIAEVLRRGESRIAQTPLQLDAALDSGVLKQKRIAIQVGGRPNLLVFPDLLSANIFYKAMELFGEKSVRLTGAFLCGLPRGVIGLMPRASRVENIIDAVRSLSILVDLQHNSSQGNENA